MRKTALLATLLLVSVSHGQSTFRLTIENVGPQPLSPLFYAAGNENFDIFQLGGTSSAGIKEIAETGGTAPMMAIAAAAGGDVATYGTIAGGPVMPGTSRTVNFTTNTSHEYFSFATMLGMSNDAFLGESFSSANLSLFRQGIARGFSFTITGLRAWDAGTEFNSQNAADIAALGGAGNPADSESFIRIHDTITPGFGDSFAALPDWALDTSLARITVEPVPEPATMTVLGLALAAMLRKRRK